MDAINLYTPVMWSHQSTIHTDPSWERGTPILGNLQINRAQHDLPGDVPSTRCGMGFGALAPRGDAGDGPNWGSGWWSKWFN